MKAAQYEHSFKQRREAMQKVFYEKDLGMWYDYDLQRHKLRPQYYASSFAPLFTQCYDQDDKLLLAKLWRYINVSRQRATRDASSNCLRFVPRIPQRGSLALRNCKWRCSLVAHRGVLRAMAAH